MKRIFFILCFNFVSVIMICQTNDTIWSYAFIDETIDEAYWNYETSSVTDLLLYRPENVSVQTVWNMHTGCYISCLYEYFNGYRFTSGGINSKDKVTTTQDFQIDYLAAMPTGEFAFGEHYIEGQNAKLLITNESDTIGFIYNTDYPQSLHSIVIQNGVKVHDRYTNMSYLPFEFHKYSIAILNGNIKFFVDDNEYSSYSSENMEAEYWLSVVYEVVERGQPISRSEDCQGTEEFSVECFPREYGMMIKNVSIIEKNYSTTAYKPILENNKQFNYAVFSNYDSHVIEYKEILLDETITLNGYQYWKQGDNLLREDVENMRVYIIPKYVQGNMTEYLLYDFSVQVGDEISVFQPLAFYGYDTPEAKFFNESKAKVKEITIEDGRKRIVLDIISRYEWLEGFGNIYTILSNDLDIPFWAASRTPYLLLCVYNNDEEVIYSTINGDRYGCDGQGTAITELPAEELLTINHGVLMLKDVMCGSAAIYSADGQSVLSFTGNTADISSLPHGLYIVRAGAKTAKFVK